jgi:hypothetical protein
MDVATKETVAARAQRVCEYCHLPEAHVVTLFTIEHILAKQHRGTDSLNNLAWSYLRCNRHKGPNIAGIDPSTGKLVRLFNPRRQRWGKHFQCVGGILIGKTAVGRTTVEVLAMNDADRVALRLELVGQGLFPF